MATIRSAYDRRQRRQPQLVLTSNTQSMSRHHHHHYRRGGGGGTSGTSSLPPATAASVNLAAARRENRGVLQQQQRNSGGRGGGNGSSNNTAATFHVEGGNMAELERQKKRRRLLKQQQKQQQWQWKHDYQKRMQQQQQQQQHDHPGVKRPLSQVSSLPPPPAKRQQGEGEQHQEQGKAASASAVAVSDISPASSQISDAGVVNAVDSRTKDTSAPPGQSPSSSQRSNCCTVSSPTAVSGGLVGDNSSVASSSSSSSQPPLPVSEVSEATTAAAAAAATAADEVVSDEVLPVCVVELQRQLAAARAENETLRKEKEGWGPQLEGLQRELGKSREESFDLHSSLALANAEADHRVKQELQKLASELQFKEQELRQADRARNKAADDLAAERDRNQNLREKFEAASAASASASAAVAVAAAVAVDEEKEGEEGQEQRREDQQQQEEAALPPSHADANAGAAAREAVSTGHALAPPPAFEHGPPATVSEGLALSQLLLADMLGDTLRLLRGPCPSTCGRLLNYSSDADKGDGGGVDHGGDDRHHPSQQSGGGRRRSLSSSKAAVAGANCQQQQIPACLGSPHARDSGSRRLSTASNRSEGESAGALLKLWEDDLVRTNSHDRDVPDAYRQIRHLTQSLYSCISKLISGDATASDLIGVFVLFLDHADALAPEEIASLLRVLTATVSFSGTARTRVLKGAWRSAPRDEAEDTGDDGEHGATDATTPHPRLLGSGISLALAERISAESLCCAHEFEPSPADAATSRVIANRPTDAWLLCGVVMRLFERTVARLSEQRRREVASGRTRDGARAHASRRATQPQPPPSGDGSGVGSRGKAAAAENIGSVDRTETTLVLLLQLLDALVWDCPEEWLGVFRPLLTGRALTALLCEPHWPTLAAKDMSTALVGYLVKSPSLYEDARVRLEGEQSLMGLVCSQLDMKRGCDLERCSLHSRSIRVLSAVLVQRSSQVGVDYLRGSHDMHLINQLILLLNTIVGRFQGRGRRRSSAAKEAQLILIREAFQLLCNLLPFLSEEFWPIVDTGGTHHMLLSLLFRIEHKQIDPTLDSLVEDVGVFYQYLDEEEGEEEGAEEVEVEGGNGRSCD